MGTVHANPFLGSDVNRPLWDPDEGPTLLNVSRAMDVVSRLAPMVSVAGPVAVRMASPDEPWHADPVSRTVYWHPFGPGSSGHAPRPLTVGQCLALTAHECGHLLASGPYDLPTAIPVTERERFHGLVNAMEDGRINRGLALIFQGYGPVNAEYSDTNRRLHEGSCDQYPTFVKAWLSWLLDRNGAKVNWSRWGQDTADAHAAARPIMDRAADLPFGPDDFPALVALAVDAWRALGMPMADADDPSDSDPGDEPGDGESGQDGDGTGDGPGDGEGSGTGDGEGSGSGAGGGSESPQDGPDGPGEGSGSGSGPAGSEGPQDGAPGESSGTVTGGGNGPDGPGGFVRKMDGPSGDASGIDSVDAATTTDRARPLHYPVSRAHGANRVAAEEAEKAGLLSGKDGEVGDIDSPWTRRRGKEGPSTSPGVRSAYQTGDLARRFAREIERRLMDNAQTAPSGGHRRGTLDTGRAHRVLTGSSRIMRRSSARGGRNYALMICADNSSSVNTQNGTLQGILAGSIMVGDGLGMVDGIDVGFCAYGWGVHAGTLPGPTSPFDRLGANVLTRSRGGTPEAQALVYAVRALSHPRYRKVDGKVILVLTDGEPDDRHDAAAIATLAASRGILTIGIGIGTGVTRPTYHRHSFHVETPAELVIAIPRAIRAALI